MNRSGLSSQRARRAPSSRRPATRAALLAGLATALTMGGVGLFGAAASSATPRHTTTTHSSHRTTTTAARRSTHEKKHKKAAAPRTFLGPDGVESSAIVAENKLPGTTAWQISGQPPTGSIAGFANTTYASVGQKVSVYVTTTSPKFTVTAYRMGYYQGTGARKIWQSAQLTGVTQPACPVTAAINMVSCDNWAPSLSFTVTKAWVQGDYLLKLVGSDGTQGYVLLTVWDPTSTAAYVVVARSLTEEGWNDYGGFSYYTGSGPCTLGQHGTYPQCNRARVVSFDRPYSTGSGSSDFLSNEYPLVRFMEQHGLDAAYVTDVTVDQNPAILSKHKAILSLGHDETWTTNERFGAQAAVADGVNLVFFGAAPVLRHSRLQPSPLGPVQEEVDYRDSTEDPLNGVAGDTMEVTGNTWTSPPTDMSENGLVGQVYSGYLLTSPEEYAVPLVVQDASAWIFKGTGLQNGAQVPGVIESDFDHIIPGQAMPPNIEVMAHSPIPLTEAFTNEGQWAGKTYSDMTYYTTSAGAGVFDSGTVNWIHALSGCAPTVTACGSAMVQKMTGNLLWLFGQGPVGSRDPSVANWQTVAPAGS
ncbi:MAG TPA: N,N-dimethylformamidase beta subunit family domain-containing protein [Acidimicrobiales bacterium]